MGRTRRAPSSRAGCNRGQPRAATGASVTRAPWKSNHVHNTETSLAALSQKRNIHETERAETGLARSQKRHIGRGTGRQASRPGAAPPRTPHLTVPSTVTAHAFTQTPKQRPDQRSSNVRAHRIAIVTLALVFTLAIPAVASARALIIGGSTSVLPLAQKLASAYHKAYKHIPAPKVSGGQSDIGIQGAATGRFDIGDSSRDPLRGVDPKGLVFTKIARDGVCLISNPANRIPSLSQETIEGIFTGKIRDWSQVPNHKISGPIDLFDRDGASGTQDAFQHIFLEETQRISPSATAETSNGLEQNAVKSDKQAIGFVSFAYTGGVHPIGYNGIPCTLRNAKSGQYLGVRNFWMVTKGVPKGAALKFLRWVTSGKRSVNKIINSNWLAIH
jgi:phosphate transport system substrate-binding protein